MRTRAWAGCFATILGVSINNARQFWDQAGFWTRFSLIVEAKARHSGATVVFRKISLSQFAKLNVEEFDVCTANMSIPTVPNFRTAFRSVATLLRKHGSFVFSMGHPCFWPIYRKDERPEVFDYWQPHAVRAPFRITLDKKPLRVPTTYFHRSLATYFTALAEAGFCVRSVFEPRAPGSSPQEYLSSFRLPRFLVVSAIKCESLI